MRALILLCLVGLAISIPTLVEQIGPFGYHERVGIPLATRIREVEDKAFAGKKLDHEDIKMADSVVSPIAAHPYLAGLIITFIDSDNSSVCGSSLLSANRLVTAAHCWYDGKELGNQLTVVLGSNMLFYGGITMVTNVVIMHPQYSSSLLLNDIAMIYLPHSVKFSPTIQPIQIPRKNNQFVGETAMAAGYGVTSEKQGAVPLDAVLRHVFLNVITVEECQSSFRKGEVTQSIICTSDDSGAGTSSGDSGGPLVVEQNEHRLLIGISSFGHQNLRSLSGFTRVTSFYNFISEHMNLI